MYKSFKAGDIVGYNNNVPNQSLFGSIWSIVEDVDCRNSSSIVIIKRNEHTLETILDKGLRSYVSSYGEENRSTFADRIDVVTDLNDYFSNCLTK